MKNNSCPDYLNNMVPREVFQTATYNLRNSNDVQNIICRTSLYYNSFLPSVIRQWNELPLEVRMNTSANAFKSYLDRDRHTPPKYYSYGNRKAQVLHTRLRLNCSSLKHHLFSKNIEDNPFCLCGEVESTSHYFLYCPNYAVMRQELLTEIRTITQPNLKLLLYGDDNLTPKDNELVFDKVHKYILNTKRFE